MGHESPIELWSPNLTTFCFVGFGTDRLRRQEAMKTADRENPTHGVTWPRNRAHGAVGQNRTRSIEWAEKQEKFQPQEKCFFLTSPFIEQIRVERRASLISNAELQIRPRDFDNDISWVYLQRHPSITIAVRSTDWFKFNVNFEVGTVPTDESPMQSS